MITFYDEPSSTGWGVPPAPGVGDGWQWNGYWYNGSPALRHGSRRTSPPTPSRWRGLEPGTLRTHVAARALFEGFLDEIAPTGTGFATAAATRSGARHGNGGWSCPSGDPDRPVEPRLGAGDRHQRRHQSDPQLLRRSAAATACMTPIQTDMPQWVIQTAEKWGLYWGGYGWNAGCQSTSTQRTVVSRDAPHFEFRGTPASGRRDRGLQPAQRPEHDLPHDRRRRRPRRRAVLAFGTSRRQACGCRSSSTPPTGAVAAMINLTATEGAAPGFLTLEDCGPRSGPRTTSALTYAAGQSVAAMAIVPISTHGTVLRVPLVGRPHRRRRHRLSRFGRRAPVVRNRRPPCD